MKPTSQPLLGTNPGCETCWLRSVSILFMSEPMEISFTIESRTETKSRWLTWSVDMARFLLGHHHPELVAAATRFLISGQANHAQGSIRHGAERLAQSLSSRVGGDYCIVLANSGTEAVEAALKHALLETQGHTLIALEGGFHGKTLGALHVTSNPHFREPFDCENLNVVRVTPNNVDQLDKKRFERVDDPAGFVYEPIQGEAGVRPLTASFLQTAAELCAERNIPLIADECQTGLARTGSFLASHDAGRCPRLHPSFQSTRWWIG